MDRSKVATGQQLARRSPAGGNSCIPAHRHGKIRWWRKWIRTPSVPHEIGLRSRSVNRRQTGRRRSDHGDTAIAVGAVDESCRLNRGNLNILSEARIHSPELIGYQVSVDPI